MKDKKPEGHVNEDIIAREKRESVNGILNMLDRISALGGKRVDAYIAVEGKPEDLENLRDALYNKPLWELQGINRRLFYIVTYLNRVDYEHTLVMWEGKPNES